MNKCAQRMEGLVLACAESNSFGGKHPIACAGPGRQAWALGGHYGDTGLVADIPLPT